MKTEQKRVKVVIPIYKNNLDKDESLSLQQCCKILFRYPIVIVKPESLDISEILQKYPQLETESFDDHFFKGMKAYNTLMLSPLFYERFLGYEYILIYQLDAYVFRDELEDWCRKSYDYIGAPWITRGIFWKKLRDFFKRLTGKKEKRPYLSQVLFKVGNGGFSLRRTRLFYEIAEKEKSLIESYLHPSEGHVDFLPEDVFWALEPHRKNYNFRVPGYKEALLFSFDKYPAECFEITHQIPSGCHAWNRKKMFKFWKKHIKTKYS